MRRIARYFVRGLLITAPLALTIYICWVAISWFDGLLGTRIPGLGVITFIAVITLVGALASNLLARGVLSFLDESLARLPFVRLLYSSTKDLLNAFVGEHRRFTRPVRVRLGAGDAPVYAIGFVTAEAVEHFGLDGHVAVYLPFSYSVAGHVVLVRRDQVTPVAADAADTMAFLVSGGVTGSAADPRDKTTKPQR